jgi:hypothetical protein
MRILKDKLPRGFGYPLKPSMLQAAMQAGKVQTEASLFQHNRAFRQGRPLFRELQSSRSARR